MQAVGVRWAGLTPEHLDVFVSTRAGRRRDQVDFVGCK